MKYLFIVSIIFFIIPVALVIFKAGEKKKKELNTNNQWLIYVYSAISIIATFGIGISVSYYGFDYFNTEYALPLIINCVLTFITIFLILSICGLAIGFVTPTTNKNLAYSIILCSFLCLGLGATIHCYRGDNFDPKTGKSVVWITPSTGKRWYNKPEKLNFDPKTGERLRQATSDDFIKKEKKQKSWKIVFQKEYTGIGFTGGKYKDGGMATVECGKDVLIGDRIIIKGKGNEQVYNRGGWEKYQYPIINKAGVNGSFYVRTKKGEKFKVVIKRFM